MDKSENKRVVLTKQLLRSALLEMLKEVPIRDVSIRELCTIITQASTFCLTIYVSSF